MPKKSVNITDFTAGEISRKFDGRVDLSIYRKGCAELENFLVIHQGGAMFRPGTYYIGEVKDSSVAARLIPFVRSAEETYLLVFNNEKFWVYDEQHARVGAVEQTIPYGDDELFEVKYLQLGDDLWLVHPDYRPYKITYTSRTSWSNATAIEFTDNQFEASDFPQAITFWQDRVWFASGSTIYASKEDDYDDFTVSDPVVEADGIEFDIIASKIRTVMWMEAVSGGIAVGTLLGEGLIMPDESGAIKGTSTPNFTWRSTFGSEDIQGRLVGSDVLFVQQGGRQVRNYYYQSKDASEQSPDLTARADHILEDGVVEFAFTQAPYPAVLFIRNDGEVAVLAYDRALSVFAWSRFVTNGSFKSVAVVPNGDYDEVWAIVEREIDGSTVQYVEYFDAFEHTDQEDAHHVDAGTYVDYGSETVTGITAKTVQDIEGITQADPGVVTISGHGYSNGDTVRLDEIEGMEELNGREFTVAGATANTFELSGEDTSGYTAYSDGGKCVETPNLTVTCSAAHGWSNEDYVYFKDIAGMTELNGHAYEIEDVSGADFSIDTLDTDDYTAYDSGGTVYRVVTELTGLTELEGETIALMVDGGTHADKTVSSGEVTLDGYFNRIHYGLGYEGTLKTMRIEAGQMLKKKRICKVRSRFYKTLGISIGPDEDNTEEVVFRSGEDETGEAPPLYNGDKEMHFPGAWSTENYIVMLHTDPTPATILALGADMVMGG